DVGAGNVLAILGVVRDRVVHVGNAAFVDQVDNQLKLVQTLEVGHFRGVTCFDQGFEAGLDQLDGTAAQNGLFAEQVGFGFFTEVGFDDAGTATADGASVRQRDIACGTGVVLMHGNQRRYTATLAVGATDGMTRGLGRNHDDVDIGTGLNLAIMHVEPVGKCQGCTCLDVAGNLIAIDLGNIFVGQQDHDQISPLDGFGHFLNFQTGV